MAPAIITDIFPDRTVLSAGSLQRQSTGAQQIRRLAHHVSRQLLTL